MYRWAKSGDFNVGKLILGKFFHAMYKIHTIKIHYILVNQTESKKNYIMDNRRIYRFIAG